jgi:ankyrin repeat protein
MRYISVRQTRIHSSRRTPPRLARRAVAQDDLPQEQLESLHVLTPLTLSTTATCSGLGTTTLQLAVKTGNKAMVRLLPTSGADVSKQDSQGRTALHIAAEGGHDEIASMLLDSLADPNETDSLGWQRRQQPITWMLSRSQLGLTAAQANAGSS